MGTEVPDFQPRGPIRMPEFMRTAEGGVCACKGPQGNAPMCPCQLRDKGLAPRTFTTPSCGCQHYPCGCPT